MPDARISENEHFRWVGKRIFEEASYLKMNDHKSAIRFCQSIMGEITHGTDAPKWVLEMWKPDSRRASVVKVNSDGSFQIFIPEEKWKGTEADKTFLIMKLFAQSLIYANNGGYYIDDPTYWFNHSYADSKAEYAAACMLLPPEVYAEKIHHYSSDELTIELKQMAEDLHWPYEKLLWWGQTLGIIER